MHSIKRYLSMGAFLFIVILPALSQQDTLTFNVGYDQEIPLPCQGCNQRAAKYGFAFSGLSNYLLGHQLLDVDWQGNTLHITANLVTDCCGYDFLDYKVQDDTLVLIYGLERNLNLLQGAIVVTCICADTGCCFDAEFAINGLDKHKNYKLALQNTMLVDLQEPQVVDYLFADTKSMYYDNCEDALLCLEEKMALAEDYYRSLKPLYVDYLIEENQVSSDQYNAINQTWQQFLATVQAIESPYIKSKLPTKVYAAKMQLFEETINDLSLTLIPMMRLGDIGR